MSNRPVRSMYYIDGSTARKIETAPRKVNRTQQRPVERERQVNRERQQVRERKHVNEKAQNALAFNLKYTVFVVTSVIIMLSACIAMLYMESRVSVQQANINELETQLETIQEENAAYRVKLESMYTLDQIYDVATNELGMVYAEKGQVVYYESADEDYVKQYQDIPEAN